MTDKPVVRKSFKEKELKQEAEKYGESIETMFFSEETEKCYFELWQIEQAFKDGYKQGWADSVVATELERIIEEGRKFNTMDKQQKKEYLCKKIENAIEFRIHTDVLYMLNFCDMPQEMATELSKHYFAVCEIIDKWKHL